MSFAAEPGGPVAAGSPAEQGLPAAILTSDDDLRLLIRGVLALDHRAVLVEGSGPEFLRLLAGSDGPMALFYDVSDAQKAWQEELAGLLRDHPSLRPIVLLPPGRSDLIDAAVRHGALAVVVRPVVLGELGRALRAAERGAREPGTWEGNAEPR